MIKIIWQIVFSVLVGAFTGFAQMPGEQIRLNQLGFYPRAPKIAILISGTDAKEFYVIEATHRDTVYRGRLSDTIHSNNSALVTRIADFSEFSKAGNYFVAIAGAGASYPFSISDQVLAPLAEASLKAFYFQRVSMPLEKKYAGQWARPAGHPDTAVLIHPSAASLKRPAGTIISSPGGWYDAGDYNKYIVNSGITMGTMLSAYEDFPDYFDHMKTNIPESGNAVPDLLDEIVYNLKWMLTMQDPNDGGVYHKCTNAAFDGMVMPGVTKLPRYVVQKGTAASLDFAAVMSQSARVLGKYDKTFPGLSKRCLKAAIEAWAWSRANPDIAYDQDANNRRFDPPVSTGAYGDKYFSDEFFWAACELLVSTGDAQYAKEIVKSMPVQLSLASWNNVYLPGVFTLMRHRNQLQQQYGLPIDSLKRKLIEFADQYLMHVKEQAFYTVMGQNKKDFVWGSNAVAANQGILQVNAWLITNDKKYIDAALSNMDYLLGKNATGYCFVTDYGSRRVLHPHHRPSVADGIADPIPGLLAGGPNPGRQDHSTYPFQETETSYVDIDGAYASNEIAINWNAPLVYFANAMEAIQYKVGYSKKIPKNAFRNQ